MKFVIFLFMIFYSINSYSKSLNYSINKLEKRIKVITRFSEEKLKYEEDNSKKFYVWARQFNDTSKGSISAQGKKDNLDLVMCMYDPPLKKIKNDHKKIDSAMSVFGNCQYIILRLVKSADLISWHKKAINEFSIGEKPFHREIIQDDIKFILNFTSKGPEKGKITFMATNPDVFLK